MYYFNHNFMNKERKKMKTINLKEKWEKKIHSNKHFKLQNKISKLFAPIGKPGLLQLIWLQRVGHD